MLSPSSVLITVFQCTLVFGYHEVEKLSLRILAASHQSKRRLTGEKIGSLDSMEVNPTKMSLAYLSFPSKAIRS